MASRERLTIIPHGVPYMTKLLRYFVSEDSIFLQLEHVQGKGPQGGTVSSSGLWDVVLSHALNSLSPDAQHRPRDPGFLEADRRTRPLWASVWCQAGREHPGRMFASWVVGGHLCRCPLWHHLLQSWLFSLF